MIQSTWYRRSKIALHTIREREERLAQSAGHIGEGNLVQSSGRESGDWNIIRERERRFGLSSDI